MVIGGTNTTSSMVEWTMSELMLHHEVIRKVQEELTEVVGINNTVEEFHVQKSPYLHAVVKEALRLHRPTPLLLPRWTIQDCKAGGCTIPKGTKVFLNVWAMHRDPQFWDSPSEFRPERFFYFGSNFEYLPFGSGKRICAGLPLGERMLMYVLATFLHMFNWKLPTRYRARSLRKVGNCSRESNTTSCYS
ncbi:putative Cytochrome P450 [Melia azedarach]|uniref:Cytochrome P450 n=1 Tax=Melia azedarach TaxID=155640 RepID=A0ACC1XN17_MELAZ|nr:putative Cytochrome P450 [Melia azedarach]